MSIVAEPIATVRAAEDWDVACERAKRLVKGALDLMPCRGLGRAEWALWPTCGCGYLLYCTACKDAVLAYPDYMVCKTCSTRFDSVAQAYSHIEPLNRRVSP